MSYAKPWLKVVKLPTQENKIRARRLRNYGDYYTATREFMPLRILEFHILLLLNLNPSYPYGLIDHISDQSRGVCQPKRSTMYRTMHRLKSKELIRLMEKPPKRYWALKRTYYEITQLGKRVLARQIKWLFINLEFARYFRMIPKRPARRWDDL